ncbi:MAG TPA: tetratricopeptide repeat protein [Pirellulales bacterium]
MKASRVLSLAVCCSLLPAAVWAADDTVKKMGDPPVKCTITSISKDGIKYEKNGKEETVPSYAIESVRLAAEPAQLNLIRNQVNNGAYENALKALDKIDPETQENQDVKAELTYLRAYSNARLALGGGGNISDAGQQINSFIKTYPNSFHFYPANELAGDLLVELGKHDAATNFYKALSGSSADAWKIKAGIDIGRAKLSEKKFDEALKEFDTALELAEKDTKAETQKLSAMLGKAACLAQTGKPEEGVKLAESVIGKLPTEEVDLHAWAYVVLGKCYRQMPDHNKQALLAFLHVDVLYFSNPQLHAEALWNLASLWQDLKKVDRATQATTLLKERYPNSAWAKL